MSNQVLIRDLKSEVLKYENLNAPRLEYEFSGKNFYRNPNSTTGIYAPTVSEEEEES